MLGEGLVMVVLPLALIAAAGFDLTSYTIPNEIPATLLLSFVAFALVAGLGPSVLGMHALAGLLGLLAGFLLFALGFVGGGDAKLFACIALWFGLMDLASYALLASVFGGALTLGILLFRKLPVPALLCRQAWIMRLHDARAGIPYGVALAAGGFAMLPYTDVFRLGLMSH